MNNNVILGTTALICTLGAFVPTKVYADQNHPISIDAQPLADAITELGAETGLRIAADANSVAGLKSTAVRGPMTPMDALKRLLSGTGLSVRHLDDEHAVVTRNFVSQDATEDAVFDLGTLILRGELIERNVQDSPTSVTVASGDLLTQRGDDNIFDLADRASNVVSTGSEENIAIRGVTQFGTGRGGSGPLVSTQVDGVSLPDVSAIGRTALPTWDVEQVEILKGPQSTQQGRNSLGGAVVIRTRDPEYANEYRLRLGFNDRNGYEAAFALNQVLVEDKLAFRLSGQRTSDDGFVDNPTLDRDDFDTNELESWRAKLRFNPTDALEIILSHSDQNTSQGESRIEPGLFPGQRVNTSDIPTELQLSSRNTGLRATYDFGSGFSLHSETNYYTDNLDELLDTDRTAVDTGFTQGSGDAEVFEQDIQLRFESDSISGVVGLFYLNSEFTRVSDTRIRGGSPLSPLPAGIDLLRNSGATVTNDNFAIFGEAEFEADRIVEGLSFTLGARYDQEDVTVRSFTSIVTDPEIPLPAGTLPDPTDTKTDASFDAFLPKLGATYEWRSGLKTSLTYQRGYRAGGASQNAFSGVVSSFDPEFTDNLEFAVRGTFLDGRLTTNANIFYTKWQDQQVRVSLSGNSTDTEVRNAGESELFGGEVSVGYQASPKLRLFADVGYLHSRFVDFQVDSNTSFAGNALTDAPEFSGSVGMLYDFQNGVSVGVDASYTGTYFTDIQNTQTAGNALLVNAQLNYESGPFRAGIFARNLLDEDYLQNSIDGLFPDTNLVQAGEPRTVGVFVEYTF